MKFNFDTTNLKHQVEQQPLLAAGVAAAVLTSVSKLLSASTERSRAKSWDRETKRRDRNSR